MQANLPSSIANAAASAAILESAVIGAQSAGTDTTETYCGMIGPGSTGEGQIIGAILIAPISAGLTASDTLYVTFTVTKRTAGASPVTIGTAVTKVTGGTGSWTQYKPVACTLASGASLAPNDIVSVATTHASTGSATPSFQVAVFAGVN